MTVNVRGIALRLCAICSTLYTLWFISFVAMKVYNLSILDSVLQGRDVKTTLHADTSPLIKNLMLLSVFILQHSLLKCLKVNCTISPALYRIFYISTSTFSLHAIYHYWEICTPLYSLKLTTQTVQILHILAWTWLASSILLVDFSELFGFKHIKHEEEGLGEPLFYKTPQAIRLLQHYRHPIAVGPLLVIFASKVLTTDRVLLGIVFTLYSFFRSNLDYKDYLYLRYVSYPTKRYKYSKVEIRSRATKTTEIHSSFLFSDEEEDTCSTSRVFDSDPGYCSSPTFHKPDYYRIISATTPDKITETSRSSTKSVSKVTSSSKINCSDRKTRSSLIKL